MSRLRTASILLINFKALANEIAKNLVLAGVGSLTILDNQVVEEDDLGAQFFISEQHVGLNVSWPSSRIAFAANAFRSEPRQRRPRFKSSIQEFYFSWRLKAF
jgi:molybdopterin/thiamine biosynthesis adenylyltransferase